MSYQFGPVERDERIDLAADEPIGEPARRRILPSPLGTALVMVLFAGGLWFAYVEGTHHAAPPPAAAPGVPAPGAPGALGAAAPAAQDAVPLIRTEPGPLKVRPDHPGGMAVPDRDSLIYNERPGGPPVEKLLPPPEQPQPRPAPAQVALAPAAPLPPLSAASPATPAPPLVRPGPRPATPVDAGAGHIRVQLGSLRTPKEAWEEWQRLKRENPELLGRLTADAVRIDLGERGVYYRILAGPFAQLGAARHLCGELKQRRLGCSIVR